MIEVAMRDELLKDGDVSDLVGEKVFYEIAEQNADYPRIVLSRISTDRQVTLGGPDTLTMARVQLDCWADESYTAALDVANACRRLFHGSGGDLKSASGLDGTWGDETKVTVQAARLENEQTFRPKSAGGSEPPMFRIIQDWIVWFVEEDPDDDEE